MTTWERKISEYEAELYPIRQTWWQKLFLRSKGGEAEIKQYAGGETRLEIDLYRLNVADGAQVQVLIDGAAVQALEVRGGYARLRLSSAQGAVIPAVQSRSRVEIAWQGETLLAGVFLPD